MTPVRLRFAPSPNGELHLGHAYSALICQAWAQRLGGTLLLRIEDIDVTRCRPEFTQGVFDDLAWLGLCWPEPVLHQSRNFASYIAMTDRLERLGVLYPCFASRKEIEAAVTRKGPDHPRDPDGVPVYPGLHKYLMRSEVIRKKTAGIPYALRLDMAKALAIAEIANNGPLTYRCMDDAGEISAAPCDARRWGDVVLVRKDVPTSYHLAVVTDDAAQGITHVTRGRDLEAATAIHRVLQVLLELPSPIYFHHGLVPDAAGRKLSKSDGAGSLRALRKRGVTPTEIRQHLADAMPNAADSCGILPA